MSYSVAASHERVSGSASFPAPTGGINDIDPWPSMEPQFCISMLNWYPSTAAVVSRGGYKEWVTGLDGVVRTMFPYVAMDGTSNLFASTDTSLYDVTTRSESPAPVLEIGNGTLNWVQMTTVAGTYLVVVNATDSGWLYDGTNWTPLTQSDTPTAPGQIKGVDPATLETVTTHKRRLWFSQEDSLTAWYLEPDSVGGTATPFYLGSIFKFGGKIKYIVSWSMDAGENLEDRLMFVSSLGEVAIYSGDDPSEATSWRLDAVYAIPKPIGSRGYVELGGDIVMITEAGILPLSRVVSGEANADLFEATVSKRISRTLNRLYRLYGQTDNWELHAAPSLQAIVVIIPAVGQFKARQFAMNIITGAWTEFNLPAETMANHRGREFFGGSSIVYEYGSVRLDNVKYDGSGGVPIQCSLFSAFSYFESPGSLKHFKMVRPIFQGNQTPSYRVKLNVDFDPSGTVGTPSNPPPSAGRYLWDSALWDDSFWSSGITVTRPWSGVKGLGFAAALLLQVASNDLIYFTAGQMLYEEADGI